MKTPRRIPILMYHQVDVAPPKGSPMRGLVVAPSSFFWHMAALWLLGYRGLSMGALEPYLRGECQGKVFGITFDDGYENNLKYALPVLKRFGFSSTCYVVADLLGQSNRWDAQRGIAQVPLMDVQQLRTWIAAGQEVGSHTRSHASLLTLNEDEQRDEIAGSRKRLEDLMDSPNGVRHFCYPYGAYVSETVQQVRAAGYTTATTTLRNRATSGPRAALLELPRVLVSRRTGWLLLLLKCFTRYEDRVPEAGVAHDGHEHGVTLD